MEEALSEIEALRSIFEDELIVEQKEDAIIVRKKVRPAEEGDVSSSAVVWVQFILTTEYPACSPSVELSTARGITEADFVRLKANVAGKLAENIGLPIIFDVLQFCSDFLLEHQHSESLTCPICLDSLSSAPVTSTPCDHYTHKECMKEHTLHTRRQLAAALKATPPHMHSTVNKTLVCPVCREVISDEIEPLTEKRRSNENQREISSINVDLSSWRQQQKELQSLYQKQLEQGGIIDLEEERKKNLISEDTVVIIPAEPVICDEQANIDLSSGPSMNRNERQEVPPSQNSSQSGPSRNYNFEVRRGEKARQPRGRNYQPKPQRDRLDDGQKFGGRRGGRGGGQNHDRTTEQQPKRHDGMGRRGGRERIRNGEENMAVTASDN